METATLKPAGTPTGRPELVPKFFDCGRIVTPADNPVYTPPQIADLLESMRRARPAHARLRGSLPDCPTTCACASKATAASPAIACSACHSGPSISGARTRGGRITLSFQFNHSRRIMSQDEMLSVPTATWN